jgi:hypothetical protein
MVSTTLKAVAVLVGLSAAGIASSAVAVAYTVVTDRRGSRESAVLLEEKLRAYRELLAAVVAFNRVAVELGEQEFGRAAERMALEQDSELDDPYRDVHQAFESNFHIIDPEVRDVVSEFLDYPATYHEDGPALGELLGKGGEVFEAMRDDLGLESIFPED